MTVLFASGTDGNDLCILCTLHSIFLKFCALCFIANPATRKLVAWFSCKFGNEKRLFVRF